ncbi:MAG TPA: ABC transporter ATP-binding protein [Deltaproteobacteria bacterium]|nr:ABC transporter ATP-binding protein [Deltaproteobacteria bacterium]
MNHDKDPLLSVRNLKVYFHGRDDTARAVDGVSYDVGKGETVCLVGESGCGKTVSALTILGLVPDPPGEIVSGDILFKGRNILRLKEVELQHIRGNQIAMVFQEPLTSLNPVFTIGNQIEEAIQVHEDLESKELRDRCIRLLKDVGIASPEQRLKDYPHQLSGGQRQRVMIAMALACNPDLIIADEPTTALDVTVQAQILNLLRTIQQKAGMSILYITHDLGVVANIADQVYVMYSGLIAEKGNTEQIFSQPRHPYTRGLLASLPGRSSRGKRLHSIPGSVPNPSHKPGGCPFHPRCASAVETCQSVLPDMCDYGKGHLSRCPVIYDLELKEKSGEKRGD